MAQLHGLRAHKKASRAKILTQIHTKSNKSTTFAHKKASRAKILVQIHNKSHNSAAFAPAKRRLAP
jgi:hypothetical protein